MEKTNNSKEAVKQHEKWRGKISIEVKPGIKFPDHLAIAYTPGVGEICKRIQKNPRLSYRYTAKGNTVAIISDGSAVLGYGNIGAPASVPVLEGKSVLAKIYGKYNLVPIALEVKTPEKFIETAKAIACNYGGIIIEDVCAPKCFEIEETLKRDLDIPVFHDDQHGTAIVTAAGVINALKLTKKQIGTAKIIVCGAGAAGIAITRLLMSMGAENLIVVDSNGAIFKGRENLNPIKEQIATHTNQKHEKGKLQDVIKGADIFIGVSKANVLTQSMVKKMAKDPIIFALSNPKPEIMPEKAKKAGGYVIATGRSDYPNQINNVLAFPYLFWAVLKVRARTINQEMKIAAVHAIASLVSKKELSPDCIIPSVLHPRLFSRVTKAVIKAARESDVAEI